MLGKWRQNILDERRTTGLSEPAIIKLPPDFDGRRTASSMAAEGYIMGCDRARPWGMTAGSHPKKLRSNPTPAKLCGSSACKQT